jgi:hypothetical protein
MNTGGPGTGGTKENAYLRKVDRDCLSYLKQCRADDRVSGTYPFTPAGTLISSTNETLKRRGRFRVVRQQDRLRYP